jgi:sugar/nucleoside kinase (ribokinase family)
MEGQMTATGFTTTDMDDNQITGYYGGAMLRAADLGLDDAPPEMEAVVIGPNAPEAMMRLSGECRERGVKFVFDPAHQLPHLSGDALSSASRGAWILIGNDYEMELVKERMGCDDAELMRHSEMVVTTLGREAGGRFAARTRRRDRGPGGITGCHLCDRAGGNRRALVQPAAVRRAVPRRFRRGGAPEALRQLNLRLSSRR